MSETIRRSTVRQLTGHGFIDLRVDPSDEQSIEAVAHIMGFSLPLAPNTRMQAGGRSAFWLGPDQWLLALDRGDEQDVEQSLRKALDVRGAVTLVSAGQTLLSLKGIDAELTVRKACSYDLSRLGDQRCVQTNFARAQVLLWRERRDEFQLITRRSFAGYVCEWIRDAAED